MRGNRKSLPPLAVRARVRARPSQAPPSGREKGVQTKAPGRPCTPGEEGEAPRFIRLLNGRGGGGIPIYPCRPKLKTPAVSPLGGCLNFLERPLGGGRYPTSPHTCEVVRVEHLAQRSIRSDHCHESIMRQAHPQDRCVLSWPQSP